jgi:hypothetical protein
MKARALRMVSMKEVGYTIMEYLNVLSGDRADGGIVRQ